MFKTQFFIQIQKYLLGKKTLNSKNSKSQTLGYKLPSSSHQSAFSLIEVSIVILIIGILLIGVVGAKHMIKNG
jgi:prepilin-type N-terminal cleavage/methylation domain-containing protein